jgi:hypothetical protein
VSNNIKPINLGRYTIFSADDPEVAKKDVIIIDISSKPSGYEDNSA